MRRKYYKSVIVGLERKLTVALFLLSKMHTYVIMPKESNRLICGPSCLGNFAGKR